MLAGETWDRLYSSHSGGVQLPLFGELNASVGICGGLLHSPGFSHSAQSGMFFARTFIDTSNFVAISLTWEVAPEGSVVEVYLRGRPWGRFCLCIIQIYQDTVGRTMADRMPGVK